MRLALTFLLLLSLALAPSALSAAATGTAWGTLAVPPSCDGTSCTLSLSTSPGDLTLVQCTGGTYGPCSVIPSGSTVIVPVGTRPVLLPCSDVPTQLVFAADLPRWYAPSASLATRMAAAPNCDAFDIVCGQVIAFQGCGCTVPTSGNGACLRGAKDAGVVKGCRGVGGQAGYFAPLP